MLRKNILILTILTLFFSLSATNVMAEGKNSPFLIVGKIPHLTKLLMQQWDNPELNLSDAQKTKLLSSEKRPFLVFENWVPKLLPLKNRSPMGFLPEKHRMNSVRLLKIFPS